MPGNKSRPGRRYWSCDFVACTLADGTVAVVVDAAAAAAVVAVAAGTDVNAAVVVDDA